MRPLVSIYSMTEEKSLEKKSEASREKWSRDAEFQLALIGYCVGLGNFWRFPVMCMRNGGGEFWGCGLGSADRGG